MFAGFKMLNEAPITPDYLNSEEVLFAQTCQRSIQNLLDDLHSRAEPLRETSLARDLLEWDRRNRSGGRRTTGNDCTSGEPERVKGRFTRFADGAMISPCSGAALVTCCS